MIPPGGTHFRSRTGTHFFGPANAADKRSQPEHRSGVVVGRSRPAVPRKRQHIFTSTNRLRAERRAKQADAPRELASINARSKHILELLLNGFRDEAWKQELQQIEQRRVELEAVIAAAKAETPAPALHPNMARVFEQKVGQLAAALKHEDAELRETARQALRGFIDRIVIPPGDALLQVVGNLGEMLTAAGAPRETAAVGNDGCGGVQPPVLAAVEYGSIDARKALLLYPRLG